MLASLAALPTGRVFVPTLYARLRDGKLWIEHDWTADGLATVRLERGGPCEDAILAFQPPKTWVHTEFTVA